eukprot:1933623-Pleurochrysis_carterae.AAC.3
MRLKRQARNTRTLPTNGCCQYRPAELGIAVSHKDFLTTGRSCNFGAQLAAAKHGRLHRRFELLRCLEGQIMRCYTSKARPWKACVAETAFALTQRASLSDGGCEPEEKGGRLQRQRIGRARTSPREEDEDERRLAH